MLKKVGEKWRDTGSALSQPAKAANGRPCRHGDGLCAFLTANKPTRPGSPRDDYSLYDVVFEGETIISNSRVPECDASRVLLARGITGRLTILDGKTGKPRTIIDIEKAAKLTVLESERRCPMFAKWRPFNVGSKAA
jgi:hypothetical protein